MTQYPKCQQQAYFGTITQDLDLLYKAWFGASRQTTATNSAATSRSFRIADPMKVLVACEMSGRVREAFAAKGHDSWSCDIQPCEQGSLFHIVADWRDAYKLAEWDLVLAFPPCTHLCVSGARHFAAKKADGRQMEGVNFFMEFTRLKCKWAIENPIGIMSTLYRKPNQIIQPWQFGHGETKATCLWLNGLPILQPTNIVSGRDARIHKMPPGPNRAKERSRTFEGIAKAMAEQWG